MRAVMIYAWAFYLGAIMSLVSLSLLNWQWWVICIPVIILEAVSRAADKE